MFQKQPCSAGSGGVQRDGLALTSPPHLDSLSQQHTCLNQKPFDHFAGFLFLKYPFPVCGSETITRWRRYSPRYLSVQFRQMLPKSVCVCGSRCPVGIGKRVTAAWWLNWQVDNGFIVLAQFLGWSGGRKGARQISLPKQRVWRLCTGCKGGGLLQKQPTSCVFSLWQQQTHLSGEGKCLGVSFPVCQACPMQLWKGRGGLVLSNWTLNLVVSR